MGITLLGLGPGDPDLLTIEAQKVLASAKEVWLRTEKHPAAALVPSHVVRRSFAELYDTIEDPSAAIAELLVELGEKSEDVIYAVPGHPLVGEAPSRLIRELASERGLTVRVVPGVSFVDSSLALLGVDPLERGLQVLDALDHRFDPTMPLLIAHLDDVGIAQSLMRRLLEQYPDYHEVAAVLGSEQVARFPLRDLESQPYLEQITCLYLAPLTPEQALGSFATLEHIVARLRAPDGCPWDREQTHESLKADFLEEAYEVLAALDARDPVALQEELGDLLGHIAFHADIGTKAGEFTWRNILRGLNSKWIRRHPHVFGDEKVSTSDEVLQRWEALKKAERPDDASLLGTLSPAMPALAYSQATQERVRRAGFDWPDIRGPLENLAEELVELERTSEIEERIVEFGDVLFNVVNIAQRLGVNAEEALRRANDKFVKRYTLMESLARQRGLDFSSLSLDQMTELWIEAKAQLASNGAT